MPHWFAATLSMDNHCSWYIAEIFCVHFDRDNCIFMENQIIRTIIIRLMRFALQFNQLCTIGNPIEIVDNHPALWWTDRPSIQTPPRFTHYIREIHLLALRVCSECWAHSNQHRENVAHSESRDHDCRPSITDKCAYRANVLRATPRWFPGASIPKRTPMHQYRLA